MSYKMHLNPITGRYPWFMSRLKTGVEDNQNWGVLAALLLLKFIVSSFRFFSLIATKIV